ncbi:hypothetical protein PV325_005200 [Microctonus aethiopoides]|nr:hypothetical protein PV325_005200 [Microctonus aethiopoides]
MYEYMAKLDRALYTDFAISRLVDDDAAAYGHALDCSRYIYDEEKGSEGGTGVDVWVIVPEGIRRGQGFLIIILENGWKLHGPEDENVFEFPQGIQLERNHTVCFALAGHTTSG